MVRYGESRSPRPSSGWLMNEDVRWETVSMSVDDRTPAENGMSARPSDPILAPLN